MRKTRQTDAWDLGSYDTTRYSGSTSQGQTNTYCKIYKLCNEESAWARNELGISNGTNYRAISPVSASEVFQSTSRGYAKFNNCDHWRNGGRNLHYSGLFNYVGNPNHSYWVSWNLDKFFSDKRYLGQTMKHPPLDLRNARATAWHTMQEEFEGNISMINFLYELKDFRDIAKFVMRQPLKKLRNLFSRFKRSARKGSFDHDFSRPIAEAHLVNQFAIKPLIRDITEIHKNLNQIVRDAQEQFQLKGLAGNTRYYSEEFSHVEPDSTYGYRRIGERFSTRFNATMSYDFKYSTRAHWDAFTQYWGLDFSAEAFWNMIPFSFLADYFIKIGNAISLMEHDPNVRMNIHQYCESLFTEKSYGYHLDLTESANSFGIIDGKYRKTGIFHTCGPFVSLYSRKTAVPYWGPVSPRLHTPTKMQAANMAALVRCLL